MKNTPFEIERWKDIWQRYLNKALCRFNHTPPPENVVTTWEAIRGVTEIVLCFPANGMMGSCQVFERELSGGLV